MQSCLVGILVIVTAMSAYGQSVLPGADLQGGAKEQVGTGFYGEQVNIVYAQPTGPLSEMHGVYKVGDVEAQPWYVYIKGRDDDSTNVCRVSVSLNGDVLFEGPNPFRKGEWHVERFAIPAGSLKSGHNEVSIRNLEATGSSGMPPWFMVAGCALGGEEFMFEVTPISDFSVTLPEEVREFPEPLAEGESPGFRIRGTKGWNWTPEQYLAEIPVLASCKMNFLMNCYLSLFDQEPLENRWWEPLSDAQKAAYSQVIASCKEHGIAFCFAIHPQLWSPRPIDPTSEADFEKLVVHYDWAQQAGVKWFSLPLDDVHVMEGMKISATEHALLVNKLFAHLRAEDPECQFIFCPTWYWGDGSDENARPYLETLARELHPEVYLFWTGDSVVGEITRKGAETYRGFAQHRIILWDNYPVNDAQQALHLGPVIGRDAGLCEVLDGYMSNPHASQNEINRIPMYTCADYAWNPGAYDPLRSIGQAIVHLEGRPDGQRVLKDLVEAYPGMLWHKSGPGFNAVRTQYTSITQQAHAKTAAKAFIVYMVGLQRRMEEQFPTRYQATRKTLTEDIQWMQGEYRTRYGAD